MGIVNSKVLLKNPRQSELEPVEVEALADSNDLRPTQRSGTTETVASDVSVGRSRTPVKHPFFGRSTNFVVLTDI